MRNVGDDGAVPLARLLLLEVRRVEGVDAPEVEVEVEVEVEAGEGPRVEWGGWEAARRRRLSLSASSTAMRISLRRRARMVGRTTQRRATRCMLAWLLSAERKETVSMREEVSIVSFPSSARRRRRRGCSMLVMRGRGVRVVSVESGVEGGGGGRVVGVAGGVGGLGGMGVTAGAGGAAATVVARGLRKRRLEE